MFKWIGRLFGKIKQPLAVITTAAVTSGIVSGKAGDIIVAVLK